MKRTIYLIYWGNGYVGVFDSGDYEQLFNTPILCLGSDLEYEWNKGHYADIQIITHEELNDLRIANGFEKKPILEQYLD